jgi:hypothetical protein
MFFCNSCERERDFDSEYSTLIVCIDGKTVKRYCRECRRPTSGTPDVYFDGKPEENLKNDPATGKPPVFLSKGAKAAYLKERGMREAGDRVHGAPIMIHMEQNKKIDTRHEVQMALKHVKEMGQDVRRQEYLRITKEGQRA